MTEKRLAANRRNASKSTGPRTEAGKAIVAQNRTVHGLRAWADVLPWEDAGEFCRLQKGLEQDLRPEGELERALVARAGSCLWRLWRAQRFEAGLVERMMDLAMERTIVPDDINELFASLNKPKQTVIDPETMQTWGEAFETMCTRGDLLGRIGRYETTLERSFQRALGQLFRLQRSRQSADGNGFER